MALLIGDFCCFLPGYAARSPLLAGFEAHILLFFFSRREKKKKIPTGLDLAKWPRVVKVQKYKKVSRNTSQQECCMVDSIKKCFVEAILNQK